jgi:hypothetical protein
MSLGQTVQVPGQLSGWDQRPRTQLSGRDLSTAEKRKDGCAANAEKLGSFLRRIAKRGRRGKHNMPF